MWFLDVDGVLAPYEPATGWCDKYLYYDARTKVGSVPYRQDVVDRVNWLHTSGLVEVRWLTTWGDAELREWQRVGLGPFDTADRNAAGPFSWWKANTVHAFLTTHTGRQIVWTDDDIEVNPHRAARIRDLGGDQLFTVVPNRDVGLTDEDLDRIEDWLTNLAQSG